MESNCIFSKYKNIFGKPKEGAHSYRIMNIAIVDVLSTILLGILISYFGKYKLWVVLVVLFTLGILVHRLFCVRTTIDRFLFP